MARSAVLPCLHEAQHALVGQQRFIQELLDARQGFVHRGSRFNAQPLLGPESRSQVGAR